MIDKEFLDKFSNSMFLPLFLIFCYYFAYTIIISSGVYIAYYFVTDVVYEYIKS
jgi:hypothetical protein